MCFLALSHSVSALPSGAPHLIFSAREFAPKCIVLQVSLVRFRELLEVSLTFSCQRDVQRRAVRVCQHIFEVSICCVVSGVHCRCATSCAHPEDWAEICQQPRGRSGVDWHSVQLVNILADWVQVVLDEKPCGSATKPGTFLRSGLSMVSVF